MVAERAAGVEEEVTAEEQKVAEAKARVGADWAPVEVEMEVAAWEAEDLAAEEATGWAGEETDLEESEEDWMAAA